MTAAPRGRRGGQISPASMAPGAFGMTVNVPWEVECAREQHRYWDAGGWPTLSAHSVWMALIRSIQP